MTTLVPVAVSPLRQRLIDEMDNLFIKGPQQDMLDWFVEFTNARGHRAYWQALEDLRALSETKAC